MFNCHVSQVEDDYDGTSKDPDAKDFEEIKEALTDDSSDSSGEVICSEQDELATVTSTSFP